MSTGSLFFKSLTTNIRFMENNTNTGANKPNTDTQTEKLVDITRSNIKAIYEQDISLWDKTKLEQLNAYLAPFLPQQNKITKP